LQFLRQELPIKLKIIWTGKHREDSIISANKKQEFLIVVMLIVRSSGNEKFLSRTSQTSFVPSNTNKSFGLVV